MNNLVTQQLRDQFINSLAVVMENEIPPIQSLADSYKLFPVSQDFYCQQPNHKRVDKNTKKLSKDDIRA